MNLERTKFWSQTHELHVQGTFVLKFRPGYLKCVDCGQTELVFLDDGLACEKCNRYYREEGGILLMLPVALEDLRLKEIAARNKNASLYDEQRPSEYTALLDYHSIDSQRFSPTDIVLDIGCGTGRSTIKLGFLVNEIFALDFSLESLKLAKAKYIESGAKAAVIFIQADANALPIVQLPRFNFINALDFIQHIPGFCARERLLGDLYGLLTPGGALSLTAYHFSKSKGKEELFRKDPRPGEGGKQGFHRGGFYYYNFHLEEAMAMIAQAGFKIKNQGLFYFTIPRRFLFIKSLLGLNRLDFESRFGRFLKAYGERLFIHAVK